MKLQINITKEILEESMYCTAPAGRNCAVAKVICNLFEKSTVGSLNIYLIVNCKLSLISLPSKAVNFIKIFDKSTPKERLNLTPFSFEIDVPDALIEEIGITEALDIIAKTPSLELIES